MRQAQAARDLLAGRIKAPLDASILPGEADREALRSSAPTKYWLPIRLAAKIEEETLELNREPIGIGQRAQNVATKIKQIDNAAASQIYPSGPVTDNLFNEGACFVITQPEMSNWANTPTSMYDDPDTKKQLSKRYAVDGKGRGEDDEHYERSRRAGLSVDFKPDTSKSAEYFTSVKKDYLARNLPISMRAISIREMVPLNPRRKGDLMILDGAVRKSEWSVSSLLQAGYRWGESGHMEQAAPEGALSSGGTRNVTHYELWYKAANGHIYTSWCIDGKTTERKNPQGEYDECIDLTEKYGIETLPIAFDYGLNFEGEINADDRPVSFVNIFGRSWLNEDTAKTHMLVRGYKEANLFRAIKLDADLLKVLGVTDAPPPIELKPGFIVYTLGDLQDLNSTGGLAEQIELIKMLRTNLDEDMPSVDALGGGSNVSAIGRNAAGRDVLQNFGQVLRGRRNIKAASMTHFNEQAACIGRRDHPICLFVNQEIPVEQRVSQQSSTRAVIEVDPEIFGDVWNVTAVTPPDFQDNLAAIQVLGDQHDRGKIPHKWLLEKGYGDQAPDVTLAEIEAELARKSPPGQARLLMMSAKIAGDEEMAAIMEGLAAQELVKLMPLEQPNPSNVVPASIGAGLQPPPHMMGTSVASPIDSQIGGMMAGAINASTNGSPV